MLSFPKFNSRSLERTEGGKGDEGRRGGREGGGGGGGRERERERERGREGEREGERQETRDKMHVCTSKINKEIGREGEST